MLPGIWIGVTVVVHFVYDVSGRAIRGDRNDTGAVADRGRIAGGVAGAWIAVTLFETVFTT